MKADWAYKLLDRITRKAKTSPAGTFAAMSDWASLYRRYGRPTDYDDLVKASLIDPTAYMCVYMPGNDLAQVPIRVMRRRGSGDTIAEKLGLKDRRRMVKRWERSGSRSVKSMVAQIGEDFEEVTDPNDPFVQLMARPNPRQTCGEHTKKLVSLRRAAGGVFEIPIVKGGVPVQLEVVSAKYMRAELDPAFGTLIREWVAHRNGQDTERYAPDELIVYGTPHPDHPDRFVSPLGACVRWVYLLWAMTEARTAMMANGGHPGGMLESEKNLDDSQRSRLEAEFAKRYAGPENAGIPIVLEQGLRFVETAKGKELDWNASIKAIQDTIKETMGIPTQLLDMQDSNLANAQEADPNYARRTLLPLAREIEDGRNERLKPMFGDGFEDYFIAFDDMVGEDLEAEARVVDMKLRGGRLTINEARALDGQPPHPDGDVLLPLWQPAQADPLAGLFAAQKALQGTVAELGAEPEIEIVVREPKALPAPCVKSDSARTLRDIDVMYGIVSLDCCTCEGCRPPRKSKEADVDQTQLFKQQAAEVARRTQAWYEQTYIDVVERLADAPFEAVTLAEFVQAAAERFVDDVSAPLIDTFTAGYEAEGDDPSLGTFQVVSDRAAELYRQHRIGLSEGVATTLVEDAQRAVDAIIEQGFDEGRRRDEISSLLADKVPGLSRSRAETIARTEVANAQLMGRLEAWEDSEFVEGKEYLLSSDPCPICTYTARKNRGKVLGLGEPFLKAGESIPLPGGGTYVVTRDVLVPPAHPRCRCSVAPVRKEIAEDDE